MPIKIDYQPPQLKPNFFLSTCIIPHTLNDSTFLCSNFTTAHISVLNSSLFSEKTKKISEQKIINVYDFLLSEEKKATPHFIGIRGEGKVVFNFILFKISSPLTSRALLIKIYAFVSFQNHQQKKIYENYLCLFLLEWNVFLVKSWVCVESSFTNWAFSWIEFLL